MSPSRKAALALLLLTSCVLPRLAAQEAPLFALLWHPGDRTTFEHMVPMVRHGEPRAAQMLMALPEGRRALLVTHPHNTVWLHREDRCRDESGSLDQLSADPIESADMYRNATGADGKPSGFSCPWLDGWIKAEVPKIRIRAEQLVQAGSALDFVIFDVESKMDWLKISRAWKAAIQNDPRWPQAKPVLDSLKQVNTGDPMASFNFEGDNIDGLAWNAYIWAQQARALTEGIFDVYREAFPGLKGSNYEHHGRRPEDTTVETYGWQFYQTAVTGTHASDSHYGWIIQAADVSIGPRQLGQNSDWLTFLFEQRKARASVRAGHPIQPWIAFSGNDFSDWRTAVRAPEAHVPNPYYVESVRHLLLLNADPLLYWNSRTYKKENKSSDEIDGFVDDVLVEINNRVGTASPRQTVTPEPVAWFGGPENEMGRVERLPDGSNLVATGLRHGSQVTYRVSPERITNSSATWESIEMEVLRNGEPTGEHLVVPAGEAGVYFTTYYDPNASVSFRFVPAPVPNLIASLDLTDGEWLLDGSPVPQASEQSCPVEGVAVGAIYASSWASATLSKPVPVVPGRYYTFSAYFLGRGSSTQGMVGVRDETGNLGRSKGYNRVQDGWTRFTFTFRATSSRVEPYVTAYRQDVCAPSLHEGVLPGRVVPGVVAPPVESEQRIQLQPGWNMVAFNVDPGDVSPDSVLAGQQAVALVRDVQGATFSTRFDIREIEVWDARTAYRVLVDEPTEIVLTGRPLALPSVELVAGWNLVPYASDEPLALADVEAAFPGLIVRAEDDRGHVYEPGGENVTLTSFEPGRAYRIYAARAAVLSFSP